MLKRSNYGNPETRFCFGDRGLLKNSVLRRIACRPSTRRRGKRSTTRLSSHGRARVPHCRRHIPMSLFELKAAEEEDTKQSRTAPRGKATMNYLQAIRLALQQEMQRDSSVFLMGQDIAADMFGATRGLFEEFGPERVRDTPICEAAMVGIA